jgi:hypothetical protein
MKKGDAWKVVFISFVNIPVSFIFLVFIAFVAMRWRYYDCASTIFFFSVSILVQALINYKILKYYSLLSKGALIILGLSLVISWSLVIAYDAYG